MIERFMIGHVKLILRRDAMRLDKGQKTMQVAGKGCCKVNEFARLQQPFYFQHADYKNEFANYNTDLLLLLALIHRITFT
jgi:hypothetical protein